MPRIFCATVVVSLITGGACQKPSADQQQAKTASSNVQPRFPEEPPTLMFDMKPAAADRKASSSQLYDCSYQSGGKTARFRIEWRQSGPVSSDIPIAAADGRFVAVEGSDNSALLNDLKKALEAKDIPQKVSRVKEIPFDAVRLGDHQSRDASGGYHDNPPGDWVLLKLFLPKGGDNGEVFLNVNPVLGKAEFSIKDEEYGDYLVAQLAKVL